MTPNGIHCKDFSIKHLKAPDVYLRFMDIIAVVWNKGRCRLPLQVVSAARSALSIRFQTESGK